MVAINEYSALALLMDEKRLNQREAQEALSKVKHISFDGMKYYTLKAIERLNNAKSK